MSVKDLFVKAPELCGAPNFHKHAKIAHLVWEHEQKENGFPRTDDEDAHGRIEFLFDWPCIDDAKKSYCMHLARLAVLSHYEKEHDDVASGKEADILAGALAEIEPSHPDVAAVLTVSTARGGWWGE